MEVKSDQTMSEDEALKSPQNYRSIGFILLLAGLLFPPLQELKAHGLGFIF